MVRALPTTLFMPPTSLSLSDGVDTLCVNWSSDAEAADAAAEAAEAADAAAEFVVAAPTLEVSTPALRSPLAPSH